VSRSAYRIVNKKHLKSALTGEGARLFGGRWNSKGTAMVYTSANLQLATIELLVHLPRIDIIYQNYSIVPLSIPEKLIHKLSETDLPEGWNNYEVNNQTQALGDRWVLDGKSAVLEVRSAASQLGINYLINPRHSDVKKIKVQAPFPLEPDPRLKKD